MLYSGLERTIIVTAIVLWFALGWYLNVRLKHVHTKLDQLMEAFDGLRHYLYEIDPQFDDERSNLANFAEGNSMFAGMENLDLTKKKELEGKRTLNTPFV